VSIKEEHLKSSLVSAALEGGKILKSYFYTKNFDVRTKTSLSDLVTDVDLMVQKAVLKKLTDLFPGVLIISEEKKNVEEIIKLEDVIYLDPLDGTLNYIHGFSQFAISIGYWVKNEPVAGVVSNPILDELFYAVRGKGAYRNGKPIHVSDNKTLDNSILCTGWPYHEKEKIFIMNSLPRILKETQEVRVTGSAALNICYVASGVVDGYWELDLCS